jgi:putative tricarboxylic transport membrane protein
MSKDRFMSLPMGEWQSPGAGIFPFCVSILLCLLGASWFFYKKRGSPVDKINFGGLKKEVRKPLKVVIITLIFILLLDMVGYLLGSLLYLFSILFYISRYRFWTSIVFSLALGGISWFFFGKILGVELPVGPEFFPF